MHRANETICKVSDFTFEILKSSEEIRKFVSKLILQENILYLGEPNYIGTFPQ